MRKVFFKKLFQIGRKDRRVILIAADTGAIYHDKFKEELTGQYINAGIAEQNAVGVAAGLAMEGKIVYIYGIIPFVTMRCSEQIRNDLCDRKLPVTIVGIGSGLDYSTLGFSHHGVDDIALMRVLPDMTIYSPSDSFLAEKCASISYEESSGPVYIRLDRTGLPLVYEDTNNFDFSKGFSVLREGRDMYIIATGRMVYIALEVAKELSIQSIVDAGVIDLFRIKPFDHNGLWKVVKKAGYILTLEEHFTVGGIGSIISEIIACRKYIPMFKTLGIPNKFCRAYGKREYLQSLYKLDAGSVVKDIKKWVKN